MIVLANRRLGPASELLVSRPVAVAMLRATAAAARPAAAARWELELVGWLEGRAGALGPDDVLDVSEIAWTPENFDRQRGFLVGVIRSIEATSEHGRALGRWAQMIEAHPRDSVQFGRRWTTYPNF